MKDFSLPTAFIACALRGALFLGIVLVLVHPCAGATGFFEDTGNLTTPRELHTATLLTNGKVLVVAGIVPDESGFPADPSASAELYDPASGAWTATGNLANARVGHTATLLPNGMVLVAGGRDGSYDATPLAELYDPTSGTWSATGSLHTARYSHTATLLPNGMVLVAGGYDKSDLASAELYDPTSGTWSATGDLIAARDSHTATLLPNDMVLVAGGYDNSDLASAELYNPASGTCSATGSLNTARHGQTATLLPNGMVLVVGGVNGGTDLASAELYDPASGTWSVTGSLAIGRSDHTATSVANGMVLVAGGFCDAAPGAISATELYNPASGTWSYSATLSNARFRHSAILLLSGKVLVAGGLVPITDGTQYFDVARSAELYISASPLITSPLVASGTVGLPFVYQFEAADATQLDVASLDLPPGLIFDPSLSAIIGTPAMEGTFHVALTASNAVGVTNATLAITVQPAPASGPVIISSTSATARTGSSFAFQVITSGGSPLERLSVEGLPAGLSADPVTGLISGTVANDGSSAVSLTVTDGGQTATGTLELTFTSEAALPVIVSPSSATLVQGQFFSYTIAAPASTSLKTNYQLIGSLPPGLTFKVATGTISGTFQDLMAKVLNSETAGRVIGSVQLFASNFYGTGTIPLVFLSPSGAANISTRLSVGTGDNVLIGGFITQGNAPMKLVLRGIGPSLPLTGVLADPYLELHSGSDTIASNDNWKDNLAGGSQEVAIENTGLAPADNPESAILGVLDPGVYTAIVHGANNGTGIGLVEVYNLGATSLDVSSEAHLANISTRGDVQTDDNVMIGGFINQGAAPIKVLLRAIGPSLAQAGVNGVLANPVLELHQPDGSVVTNDDWMARQEADIAATGLAPTNELESAILLTLPVGEGAYTAVVRGANDTTGVGLVEAYFGDPCLGTSCP
jgi:Putative Ig domain/Galactose oxidase, central domain/Kelch motif